MTDWLGGAAFGLMAIAFGYHSVMGLGTESRARSALYSFFTGAFGVLAVETAINGAPSLALGATAVALVAVIATQSFSPRDIARHRARVERFVDHWWREAEP